MFKRQTGTCPVCNIGEIEEGRCNNCQRSFCPACGGIKDGDSENGIKECDCTRVNQALSTS